MKKGMKRSNKLILTAWIALFFFICLLPPSLAPAVSRDPEAILMAYLKETYPWEEIEIRNVDVVGTMSGEDPEKIVVEKGPLGNAVFSFLFASQKRIIVKAKIRAFGRVVKSRRPLKKGHVVLREDLYIAKMDIRKMPSSTVTDPGKIMGKTLKRSITANIPVVEDMIEMLQVVERGRRVVLMISRNGLRITAVGKTKEKGYVGLPVKAINLSSKKVVSGVLIDANTVRVEI